jgi:hypothetical protein
MTEEHLLIALTDDSVIYARPDGWHYHLRRDCPMLEGDFERFGYTTITKAEVEKRRLWPCLCAYEGYDPTGAPLPAPPEEDAPPLIRCPGGYRGGPPR